MHYYSEKSPQEIFTKAQEICIPDLVCVLFPGNAGGQNANTAMVQTLQGGQ